MRELTPEGEKIIGAIAERHGLSVGAVKVMLEAVARGGGTMAQFSHPEFGGSGQWLRGGMTMVGDMFNNSLKTTVDALCSELSALLGSSPQGGPFHGASQSQSQGGMASSDAGMFSKGMSSGGVSSGGMSPYGGGQPSIFAQNRSSSDWWPSELGIPSSVGSQNDTRYAHFPQKRRLAIHRDGRVEVLDTGEHIIHGFGQQQGGGAPFSLSSQLGTVSLESLKRVGEPVHSQQASPPPSPAASGPAPAAHSDGEPPRRAAASGDAASILGLVEKLAELRDKGVLSEDEFSAKKAELLSRL